jgi:phosphoribosyl 1,2-cyclic phosphate phosphodiesterase
MKFIILGCGSSMGVPRPDGFFGNCDPNEKKNYRTRCSALIKTDKENVLIDTSPDLRQQLLRHKIRKINKVFYSHMHADQTHGINDLRSFYINNKKPIEVFADKSTSEYLKDNFSYCFKSNSKEYPATLNLNKISDVSDILKKDFKYFNNLKYLIIDCLWYNFHPSHLNLEKSLNLINYLKPEKAILTNLSPVLDYKVLKKLVPKNVIPAYDGLTIKL